MKKIFILGKQSNFINYSKAIENCGATPVFSCSTENSFGCDALLMPGGGDIAPCNYKEENLHCQDVDTLLDEKEFDLIKLFHDANKPIMGICRGLQSINVALGGSLIQDILNVQTHSKCGGQFDKIHSIRTNGDNFLSEIYGEDFIVNSAHHQAIKIPAPCLDIIAYSNDGLVEAVKHKTKPIFAVQWHPERIAYEHKNPETVDGSLLFDYFMSLIK
ncbi:MAG: type 1 glutamine amidotransferase [Clostridia bacterium]